MPNWCSNSVSVTHDGTDEGKAQLADVLAKLRAGEKRESGRFVDLFFPIPHRFDDEAWERDELESIDKDIETNLKETGFRNFEDYTDKTFSVIRCFYLNVQEVDNHREVIFSFDSAWSPPSNFFKNLALKYPNLSWDDDYIEEGNGFKGNITAHDDYFDEQTWECNPSCIDCGDETGAVDDEGDPMCDKCMAVRRAEEAKNEQTAKP